jgi:UDP-3-O-[3-hydroxymyristoyl] glucosamine N-acyltransferase
MKPETQMTYTVQEIADALGAKAVGDVSLTVTRASEPATASPDAIALAMNKSFAEKLKDGHACVAMLADGADFTDYGLKAAIYVARPRYAMSGLTQFLDRGPAVEPGIHPSAIIDPTAEIGADAAIGPLVVIARGCKIGEGAQIASHCSIGADTVIGDQALIHEGVRIGARIRIGHRFICQPGAVIGGDGFSFVTPEPGAVEAVRSTLGDTKGQKQQAYARIHSLGSVVIEDDVEVGANSCIDRGTIADTFIGRGSKLDNLVQIGHNVRLGEDCLLCGMAGIAGSAVIGNRAVFGGQSACSDHLTIGDDFIAALGTVVRTNQPAGKIMLGNPAMEMSASIEAYKASRRLPRLFRDVAELKKMLPNRGAND